MIPPLCVPLGERATQAAMGWVDPEPEDFLSARAVMQMSDEVEAQQL
jgi:hypothetical protein